MRGTLSIFIGGGILGLALGLIIAKGRPTDQPETREQTSAYVSSRTIRPHEASTIDERQSQSQASHSSLAMDLFQKIRNLDALALNSLDTARIFAEIGSLNEAGIHDLLAQFQELNIDWTVSTEFHDQTLKTTILRWLELAGPEICEEILAPRYSILNELGNDSQTIAEGIGLWTRQHPKAAKEWLTLRADFLQAEDAPQDQEELLGLLGGVEVLTTLIENYELARTGKSSELASLFSNKKARETVLEISAKARVKLESNLENLKNMAGATDPFLANESLRKIIGLDLDYVKERIAEGRPTENQDVIIAAVADALISQNYVEGAAWYQRQNLSEPASQTHRLSTLFRHFTSQGNREEGFRWLESQPNTAARDNIERMAAQWSLSEGDITESIRWIKEISDPQTQRQVLNEFVSGTSSMIPTLTSSGMATVSRNSIEAILNNPIRTNADFISTVDRVFIPGIPPHLSNEERENFIEAAKEAGLLQRGN